MLKIVKNYIKRRLYFLQSKTTKVEGKEHLNYKSICDYDESYWGPDIYLINPEVPNYTFFGLVVTHKAIIALNHFTFLVMSNSKSQQVGY